MADPLPQHTRNPLTLTGIGEYFDHCRNDVIDLVKAWQIKADRVIELGCASGKTGAVLKPLVGANYYAGVDSNAEAVGKAGDRLDAAQCVDLNTQSPRDVGLAEQPFDLLVALDVLEHLYNPWDVLAQWGSIVKPGGHLVTSIPNVGHYTVIGGLASGNFDYGSHGLLDATHIRFFTNRSALDLIEGAGFSVVASHFAAAKELDASALTPTGNAITLDRLSLKDLTKEEVISICTHQFIVLAQKGG